jgi:hypothetical protein
MIARSYKHAPLTDNGPAVVVRVHAAGELPMRR